MGAVAAAVRPRVAGCGRPLARGGLGCRIAAVHGHCPGCDLVVDAREDPCAYCLAESYRRLHGTPAVRETHGAMDVECRLWLAGHSISSATRGVQAAQLPKPWQTIIRASAFTRTDSRLGGL